MITGKGGIEAGCLPTRKTGKVLANSRLRFGSHKVSLRIVHEGLEVSIDKNKNQLKYHRCYNDVEVDKTILTDAKNVLITPVEPMNIPKQVSNNLLVNLEQPLIVEPKKTQNVYLSFPVEIGVFITEQNCSKLIDVFTFVRNKYSLYGTPKTGVVCRYWKSKTYTKIPELDPIHEGVLKLTIINKTSNWMEINNIVFYGYGMEIYYNKKMVSMVGTMKIISEKIAETDIIDTALMKGQYRALETFPISLIPLAEKKYVMEEGV
jgi:hypothetical protein